LGSTSDIWSAIDRARLAANSVDLSWVEEPPSDDGWTLAPDALRFAIALVGELRPRHVLELGSGLSTRALARAASELDVCFVSSLENDPEQALATRASLDRDGLSERVSVQAAPLVARDRGGKVLPAYLFEPASLRSPDPLDIVFVDGPPAALGGREGALYQFLEMTRPGSVFVLDDASRNEERAALAAWEANLSGRIEIRRIPSFAKGLAAVVVCDPLEAEAIWEHKIYLTRNELTESLGGTESFLLADGWALEDEVVPAHSRAFRYPGEVGAWDGDPANQAMALQDLDRLADEGFQLIAIAWPCAWWNDCYTELMSALRRSPPAVENDRVSIFRLGPP
jgi:predicted O-methyltransferase YrrM